MGRIIKAICPKCKYEKDLHCGSGMSGCNINFIKRIFSDDIFSEFETYRNENKVKTFFMENKVCYCAKCKELKTTPVLNYTLESGEKITKISLCSECSNEVDILKDDEWICPKCGEVLDKEENGLWD